MSGLSVNSPTPPPPPISESFKKNRLNMKRLTGLNYVEWLHKWRMVLSFAGKPYLIEYPLPIPPKHGITQQLFDEHDFLINESGRNVREREPGQDYHGNASNVDSDVIVTLGMQGLGRMQDIDA
ncbi:hypothetical protein L2E82_30484 [Cichorium intybus]|uniref:Uncharacterized protein n=1 Tax=Cichorium intybus TaxID=13427 RepID=A0ACB9D0Z5_CICIN|nr:hypothetical protein L2E82_30484 [Cichorium intybus]